MSFPLGVSVTLAPATRFTASLKPLSDFTTWPEAILVDMTEPSLILTVVTPLGSTWHALKLWMAYGAGSNSTRGVSTWKGFPLLQGRTSNSNQRRSQLYVVTGPKFSSTMKIPLVTGQHEKTFGL